MSYILTERKEHLFTIKINRPEKQNALSPAVLAELQQALDEVRALADVRVVILTGAGTKAFSAGFDISEIKGSEAFTPGVELAIIERAYAGLRECPVPVIAMVNGHAIGAGCDLMLNCDLRIAAEQAMFGIPAVKLGVIYSVEGIARLVASVGLQAAREVIYSGRLISANRARDIGLVNEVVKAEELEAATYSLAREIAANAPLSVQGFKSIFRLVSDRAAALDAAQAQAVQAIVTGVMGSEDAREGPRAFEEKRKPSWSGR